MANGKNGTTCWLAGAVRTLMKRVEMLEASNSFKNVDRNIHVNTSVPRSKVRASGRKTAVDVEHEDDFKQVLSDEDGLADTTVPWVTVRSKEVVGALNFLYVNSLAVNRVETVPFRYVTFAENVETVEFDPAVHGALSPLIENNTSAPNLAYRAYAAPAPAAEFDAALMMAHQAHATPVPMVEYDAASTETHWACAAPTVVEHDAYSAQAVPSPLVDGSVVKVVQVPQVQVVEKTIEIPQLHTIEKIVDIPEIQTREAVLREFDDEELCCDDLEEICYMTRTSRKRLWRRVWHDCSSPSDASKSERSWRRLWKCLRYEDEFDEMMRTCAYCGRFEDDDDISVRCQGPNCSLRSVDYELPGLFHVRCAAAFGLLRKCTLAELSMVPSCKACR